MMNAMCGTDWNDAAFPQNPWLTHANPRVSLVCTAPLEPADNGISLSLPQRGTAYQRRVKPWVDERHDSRVLKERHILVEGGRVTDQRLCAIPSERMNGVPRIPRALLGWYASPRWRGTVLRLTVPGLHFTGMHCPVGAMCIDYHNSSPFITR